MHRVSIQLPSQPSIPNPDPGPLIRRAGWVCFFALLTLGLGACDPNHWDPALRMGPPTGHVIDQESLETEGTRRPKSTSIALSEQDKHLTPPEDREVSGTGTFVRKVQGPHVRTKPGDITLNFDGTDIREVVKVILGDVLQLNYILDPKVSGTASLQTGRPLRRKDLIPTLETLLRMNNAALVYNAGTYEVVPLKNAIQGRVVPQLGEAASPLPHGYSVQVVPLQYIGADEMSKILQPLAPEGSIIRVDSLRNILLIAGTSPELGNLLDTIQVFDVDWMAGLSVGFFSLEYAAAKDVVNQLENLLADENGNPFKGLFRFIPIESANSLLVVSPKEAYLKQAKRWIERLDLAEATGNRAERLFVYRVKHGDAENLAKILTDLFAESKSKSKKTTVGSVAPGKKTASATSKQEKGTKKTRKSTASSITLSSEVSIVADTVNNSLLIKSSPRDYKKILDALKQLDLVPLQVLVEATIIEITLSGSLQYGVQWEIFGGKKDLRNEFSLDGTLDSTDSSGIGKSFPGFNWAVIVPPETIRATLSALAGDGLVNVLSSPSVMVLDNQEASMQVGKEVPIATTQQQSTTNPDANIVNQIEYKSTGVQLTVKPRVTPGGLVQMEIKQEVSTVSATDTSALNSPTFQTRKINSNVAVRSGQAVVLGGLIQDIQEEGQQGVPGLYNLPVVGSLFGERKHSADRTELVVILTPKVITSDQDVESVTESFRARLRGLKHRF